MTRYRCPMCSHLMWSPRAMCAGGDPIYDPQALKDDPLARRPEHDPVLGIPDGDDPTPHRERKPFEVRHLPYIAIVQRQGSRLAFGPFQDTEAVDRFLADHRLFGYAIHALFTPGEAHHFRQ